MSHNSQGGTGLNWRRQEVRTLPKCICSILTTCPTPIGRSYLRKVRRIDRAILPHIIDPIYSIIAKFVPRRITRMIENQSVVIIRNTAYRHSRSVCSIVIVINIPMAKIGASCQRRACIRTSRPRYDKRRSGNMRDISH